MLTHLISVLVVFLGAAIVAAQAPDELGPLRSKNGRLNDGELRQVEAFVKFYADRLQLDDLEARLAAHRALVANASGGPFWFEYAIRCNQQLLPIVSGPRPEPALQAAIVLASLRQEAAFSGLAAGLDHPSPAVRYWCVKGLADAEVRYKIAAFHGLGELRNIAEHALAETVPKIIAQYYRIFERTDPKRQVKDADFHTACSGLLTLLESRLERYRRLGQPLIGPEAEVAAVPVIAAMAASSRANEAERQQLLSVLARLMSWTAQRYWKQQHQLTDSQQLTMERLIIECYRALAADAAGPNVEAALLNLDRIDTLMRINEWTGAPGVEGILNRVYDVPKPGPLQ